MENANSSTSVDLLGFTLRTRNTLRRAKIDTLSDLLGVYKSGNLRKVKSLGKVQYREILEILRLVAEEDFADQGQYLYSKNYNIPEEIEAIPLRAMKLNTRLHNCLCRTGCKTVGDVVRMKRETIYKIRGIGKYSIDELKKVVTRIENEGAEYFKQPDPMLDQLSVNPREMDITTVRNLKENYGLKTKWIAEWYGVSESWINEKILHGRNTGNWCNRVLTNEDVQYLEHMLEENLEIYSPDVERTIYLINNHKDDCAVVIINRTEIKCFYLDMLPEELRKHIREKRRESLTHEEFMIIREGEIVSVLKKKYFRPKDSARFFIKAKLRNMSSEEYSLFLTGLPLLSRQVTVTDDRIMEFLRKYCKNGKISMPIGENCQWFRSFIFRNGYTIKDILELYDF